MASGDLRSCDLETWKYVTRVKGTFCFRSLKSPAVIVVGHDADQVEVVRHRLDVIGLGRNVI